MFSYNGKIIYDYTKCVECGDNIGEHDTCARCATISPTLLDWRGKLIGKLRAEEAKSLNDETLERTFAGCVSATRCIAMAKKLRDMGSLNNIDLVSMN